MGSAIAGECLSHAAQAERAYDIPAGLIQAIAQVESGGTGVPNPLALAVGRRSLRPTSQEQAVRLLRSRPAKGVFVGCMQLSLRHHQAAFGDTEAMLDPAVNVDYGARLLVHLQVASGSWVRAVQLYQGGKPAAQRRYACKIAAALRQTNPDTAEQIDFGRCPRRLADS